METAWRDSARMVASHRQHASPGTLVIAKILGWSAEALLVIVLVAVAAVVAFRLAAFNRETGVRDVLAPSAGRLVMTDSGGVFIQEKGPADGIPIVLFHGPAARSEL